MKIKSQMKNEELRKMYGVLRQKSKEKLKKDQVNGKMEGVDCKG